MDRKKIIDNIIDTIDPTKIKCSEEGCTNHFDPYKKGDSVETWNGHMCNKCYMMMTGESVRIRVSNTKWYNPQKGNKRWKRKH